VLLAASCLAPQRIIVDYDPVSVCLAAIKSGTLLRAQQVCEEQRALSPHDPALLVNLGVIAVRRAQPEVAKAMFLRALRLNPEFAEASNDLGVLALEAHDLVTAEASFRQALRANPDYLEARYHLAKTFVAQGHVEQARQEYEAIITANPNLELVSFDLGTLAASAGDFEGAARHFARALTLDPTLACAAQASFEACAAYKPAPASCRETSAELARQCSTSAPR
jgi:tetratricopeptide (TPR) repeat protein